MGRADGCPTDPASDGPGAAGCNGPAAELDFRSTACKPAGALGRSAAALGASAGLLGSPTALEASAGALGRSAAVLGPSAGAPED